MLSDIGENKYNKNRDVINTQNGGNVQDIGRDAMHCVSPDGTSLQLVSAVGK